MIKERKPKSVNNIQYCFFHESELEQIAAVSTFFDCATFRSIHAKESIHGAQFLFKMTKSLPSDSESKTYERLT